MLRFDCPLFTRHPWALEYSNASSEGGIHTPPSVHYILAEPCAGILNPNLLDFLPFLGVHGVHAIIDVCRSILKIRQSCENPERVHHDPLETEKEHLGVKTAEGLALYVSRSHCDAVDFAVADRYLRLRGCIAIVIFVGPTQQLWVIQKDLITAHSLFFHCALLGVFGEAHNNVVTLPEDDPDIFGLFVRWLYTGIYKCLDDVTLLQSAKAWILGEKVGVTALQNHVIQGLFEDSDCFHVRLTSLSYVYAHTVAGSKLRLYLTDRVAYELKEEGSYHPVGVEEWSALLRKGGDVASDLFVSLAKFEDLHAALRDW